MDMYHYYIYLSSRNLAVAAANLPKSVTQDHLAISQSSNSVKEGSEIAIVTLVMTNSHGYQNGGSLSCSILLASKSIEELSAFGLSSRLILSLIKINSYA